MRNHPVWKASAIVLSAVMVVIFCFSFMSFWFLLETDLYSDNVDQLIGRLKDYRAESLAYNIISRYANEHLSDVPAEVLAEIQGRQDDEAFSQRANLEPGTWTYEIRNASGALLESTVKDATQPATTFYNYSSGYFRLADADEDVHFILHSHNGVEYYIQERQSPHYQVSLYIEDNSVTAAYGLPIESIRSLYDLRYYILAIMAVSALGCLGCLVYLFFAAGKSRFREGIRPGGLNRIPLDIYIPAAAFCCWWLLYVIYEMSPLDNMYYFAGNTLQDDTVLRTVLSAVFAFAGGILATGTSFAAFAQGKAPDRYWLKNTVSYRVLSVIARGVYKLFSLLPVMWQWLLVGIGMGFSVLFSVFVESEILLLWSIVNCLALIVYGAYAFGTLLQGAKQLAEGNLEAKVPTKFLLGSFRDMGRNMNQLADAAVASANAKMKSDRMKTELITNISHDIKTPLTSIINYTDLLGSAQTEQQKKEYLVILEHQSLRLKKLIEDLTELSKASTGNIQANTTAMDGTEALTQALGEFSDKMMKAQLQICPDIPNEPVMIQADGRLFWRVAANLLSNVVKYSLPGTRVYVSLKKTEYCGVISIKNISREPLNISAEELMERFVRGDQSRNTEGSGLGLSIAASLMEVQRGSLKIEVNGDLFSAQLQFPLV